MVNIRPCPKDFCICTLLQANEAEEAGRTARDIEARMRKERDRGLGFDDAMDAEAIENYYRFAPCFVWMTNNLSQV
jgi:hypothetical protein